MLTGLVSTALGLMGVLTWLIAGTRNIKSAERDLLRRYTAVYESATGRPLGGLVGSHASAHGLESDDTRVSAPGMRAYHRTSCPVVRGKAIVLQAASEFDERRACAMCQP